MTARRRTQTEIEHDLTAVDSHLAAVKADARALRDTIGDADPTADQLAAEGRFQAATNELLDERGALRGERLDLQQRHDAVIAALAGGSVERAGVIEPTALATRSRTMPATPTSNDYARSAFAAIEQINLPAAQDRLDGLVRAERLPVVARYLAAVGSPVYGDAFASLMRDPQHALFTLSPEQRAALAETRTAMQLLALSTSTGSDGGFALPMLLDPTLIFTNDGSTNPFRSLATVKTITQRSIKVVTADQFEAGYGAEGSDATEASPTLGQPEIKAERATSFVKLTFEMFSDWANGAAELARGFADAKDNVEASAFAVGSGSDEPEGIVTGLTAFAGAVSTPSDLYDAQADLGARWQARSRWLMSLSEHNVVHQLVAQADPTNAPIEDAAGNLLKRPVTEASYMPDATVIYGDTRAGFCIADRLGMSIEQVPVLFNKDTGLPSGHRGVLAIWRSGSKVVIPAALRLLAPGS